MSDKKISCRVCGKLFVPCAYCHEHSDSFKWRNFACSIECAKKYISEAVAYRESGCLGSYNDSISDDNKKSNVYDSNLNEGVIETHAPTRKRKKKTLDTTINTEVEDKEIV